VKERSITHFALSQGKIGLIRLFMNLRVLLLCSWCLCLHQSFTVCCWE